MMVPYSIILAGLQMERCCILPSAVQKPPFKLQEQDTSVSTFFDLPYYFMTASANEPYPIF